MRISLILAFTGALLAIGSPVAFGADPAAGKQLHDEQCVACHRSLTSGHPDSLYTRPDRRVTSLEGLRKQVRRCELSLGLRWFDNDIDDVTAYLNENFYRF